MVENLGEAIQLLDSWGVYEVLLPFILIFAIVFAILNKVNILGKKRNVHVGIALVTSLTVVIVHVKDVLPEERDAVSIINKMIPQFSLLLVILFVFLLLISVLGGGVKKNESSVFAFIIIFAILFNIFFLEYYPNIAPIFLWITLFVSIITIFRKHSGDPKQLWPGWILIFVFLFIFSMIIYLFKIESWPRWFAWMKDPVGQMAGISLLIMFAVIAFIGKEDSGGNAK